MKRRTFLTSSTILSGSIMFGVVPLALSSSRPMINFGFQQSLLEIDKWLQAHASKIRGSLRSAITSADVEVLKKASALNLPEDLVSLYKWHDGIDRQKIGNLFYGFVFEPSKYVASRMQGYSKSVAGLKYADPGVDKSYIFSRTRVPIADDSGHCFLCIDLAPTTEGKIGQVIMIDEEYLVALRICGSVSELISCFANDLMTGKYGLQQDALEDGNEWLSPSDSIDLGNWFNSPTWARAHSFAK